MSVKLALQSLNLVSGVASIGDAKKDVKKSTKTISKTKRKRNRRKVQMFKKGGLFSIYLAIKRRSEFFIPVFSLSSHLLFCYIDIIIMSIDVFLHNPEIFILL